MEEVLKYLLLVIVLIVVFYLGYLLLDKYNVKEGLENQDEFIKTLRDVNKSLNDTLNNNNKLKQIYENKNEILDLLLTLEDYTKKTNLLYNVERSIEIDKAIKNSKNKDDLQINSTASWTGQLFIETLKNISDTILYLEDTDSSASSGGGLF